MRFSRTGRACAAATTALGLAALLQVVTQAQSAPGAAPSKSQERAAPEQQVTVTGCIQREADYRRARGAGRGGVAGTGAGVGNEFVLINASMSPATSSGAADTPATPTGAPAGTAGSAAGTAYELTGPNESKADQYVGRRVEISGKLKAAEVGSGGRATGGATAGKPPEGVEVAGRDLKLRELEVTTIKEASGTCPAA